MEDLKDKSNNELLMEVKNLESSYNALKQKMLNDWDQLMIIEERFNKINELIQKRLKG